MDLFVEQKGDLQMRVKTFEGMINDLKLLEDDIKEWLTDEDIKGLKIRIVGPYIVVALYYVPMIGRVNRNVGIVFFSNSLLDTITEPKNTVISTMLEQEVNHWLRQSEIIDWTVEICGSELLYAFVYYDPERNIINE